MNGNDVVIPVGKDSGVRLGDKFSAYNVDYLWQGDPCTSQLLLEKKTTNLALVQMVAVQVENNATLLKVISRNDEGQLRVGARVEIAQLAGSDAASRRLARTVALRSLQSEPLPLPDGTGLNLKVYMEETLRAVMDEYGLHARN